MESIMKKYAVSAVLGICIALPSLAFSVEPKTFNEKLSYSMGVEVGNYFKGAGDDIDRNFLLSGIEDAFNGSKPILSSEEMAAVKKKYAEKMQMKQVAQLEAMKIRNKAEGDAYLEKNLKKDGVIETASGLQYEVLQEGKGDKAKETDTVKVEYVGTLINGKEFDSTKKHGEPAKFQVGQVIKGWSEALQLMSVGAKLRLAIPSELAYGEQGVSPMIQPNSVLLFDVELLEILKD